ncbi:MAG: VOC family protein [Deltaproteobacteria bacterium]|nr:VOC family protein [Deltaproteobacteria bacterium]
MSFKLTKHIAFQVKNHKKAAKFYQNVLGMKLLKNKGKESELKCGDVTFYVEESNQNNTFFDFEVRNISEAKEKLISAGCKITQEYSQKSIMVSDPFGLKFHLWETGASKEEIGC